MKPKKQPKSIKGLSDEELAAKYDSGKINMKKLLKPALKKPKK